LRARPAQAGPVVAVFLSHTDARVRADAANTLARLRSKDANERLRALLNDADAVVRANAARALGAAEDGGAFEALLDRSTNDADQRVRVSAIRALAALKDARAAAPLLAHAAKLFASYRAGRASGMAHPREMGELLEIATTLGRILANTGNQDAINFLRDFRATEEMTDPEIEIAFARVSPALYLREKPFGKSFDANMRARVQKDWRVASSLAQGLGEINGMTAETAGNGIVTLQADAQMILRSLIEDGSAPALGLPDLLRALVALKSGDPSELLRKELKASDVIVRATAAELLGELPPAETNARALAEALPAAMRDELNDAALAILEALARQKSDLANNAIKTALDSPDHLLRRRAVALLKANNAGDFSARIGTVATRNTNADYQRALARAGRQVRAVVMTDKGSFTIELLPEAAPLNVDNFVQLARRDYFNNITFHRVVPNFVVQGGDPRGDGNGGPGYQIRCEINEEPYGRGAVGMALSGKDTGGSQWFVTHSPQPHLDGGYTVFGRVVAGMDVVDQLNRGDRIHSISITEGSRKASKTERTPAASQKAAPAARSE
jgi:cyclophilin family peptidyl-prolyl cis-trans isomerase/HEAT repeat protein